MSPETSNSSLSDRKVFEERSKFTVWVYFFPYEGNFNYGRSLGGVTHARRTWGYVSGRNEKDIRDDVLESLTGT